MEKDQEFEAFSKLAQFWWTSFDQRRSYEWKINLAIWTAFAAFIAIVATGDLKVGDKTLWSIGTALAALSISFTHFFWIYAITFANEIDRKKAFYCEYRMRSFLSDTWPKDIFSWPPEVSNSRIPSLIDRLVKRIEKRWPNTAWRVRIEKYWSIAVNRVRSIRRRWPQTVQISITVVLSICTVLAVGTS